MSAINIHIGTQDPRDRDATLHCTVDGERVTFREALDGERTCIPDLASTHNGLTRMLWIRRSLEDILATRAFYVTDGVSLGKAAGDRARLYLVIDPPILQDEISWMLAGRDVGDVALVGEAGKMACPTWDLPAGSMLTGGSCPGALAGQSIVPADIRRKGEAKLKEPIRLRETICQICYAEGGNYQYPDIQVGELVRYWWCRTMLESGREDEMVDTMVRGLEGELFPEEPMTDPRTGEPVLPVRIHSSGDFFSVAYARAWIKVANALPQCSFWAPTRTWASPGWMDHWRKLIPMIKHDNLAIRPSAFHTGDPTPSPEQFPWEGDYVFPVAGSTTLYAFDNAGDENGHSIDPRYDWNCQTYAVNGSKDCRNALNPEGNIGCRACWLRGDLRVNYTAH